MVRPKALLSLKQNQVFALVAGVLGFVLFVQLFVFRSGSGSSDSPDGASYAAVEKKQQKEYPVHIHATEVIVPAASYSGPLRKPLEVVDSTVSCPERGVSFHCILFK